MTEDNEDSSGGVTRPIRTIPRDADPDGIPKAVAARIGDRDLWIANVGAIRSNHLAAMDLYPEYVVSVNQSATWATTDHHPLKDGHINNPQKFATAVEATRENIKADGTVIVNCSAGISRSSTVIATAIAAADDISFTAAVEEIKQTRQQANPHPKLQLNAYAYLGTVEDREAARQQLADLAASRKIRHQDEDVVEKLPSFTQKEG